MLCNVNFTLTVYILSLHILFLHFVWGYSWLTILWQFQVARKGTQPYMYLFSPKLPSHPGCHVMLSRVPCALQRPSPRRDWTQSPTLQADALSEPSGKSLRTLLVIRFTYSSVHVSIPNPLTIPSPSLLLATIISFSKSVSVFVFAHSILQT